MSSLPSSSSRAGIGDLVGFIPFLVPKLFIQLRDAVIRRCLSSTNAQRKLFPGKRSVSVFSFIQAFPKKIFSNTENSGDHHLGCLVVFFVFVMMNNLKQEGVFYDDEQTKPKWCFYDDEQTKPKWSFLMMNKLKHILRDTSLFL